MESSHFLSISGMEGFQDMSLIGRQVLYHPMMEATYEKPRDNPSQRGSGK